MFTKQVADDRQHALGGGLAILKVVKKVVLLLFIYRCHVNDLNGLNRSIVIGVMLILRVFFLIAARIVSQLERLGDGQG